MNRTSCFRAASLIALWASFALIAGCNSDESSRAFDDEDDVENIDPIVGHSHAHAPHDGQYVVFGSEEYHGEVVFNEETGELTVYILGPDGQTAHPITAESVAMHVDLPDEEQIELWLPAAPDAGDADGASSRFRLTGDSIPEGFDRAESVSVTATIEGTEYEGEVIAEEDPHHGHSHSHDDEGNDGDEAAHSHEGSEDDHTHADEEADRDDSADSTGEADEVNDGEATNP